MPQIAQKHTPLLMLAPMEGLVDPLLREVWTHIGGYDLVTTEFIRVNDQSIPPKVFFRDAPELRNQSRTKAGTPLFVQLLGGDPLRLAENALTAVECGAVGIDLNFGCPAPTVNRNDGGATLLKYPDRIFSIVSQVRAALPSHIPLTAKLRLGFSDTALCLQNSRAAAGAGASRLTLHCRTKADFYRPPAYWEWIPMVREHLSSHGLHPEIIANGEIWTLDDFIRCQATTKADGYMLGRGAVANPFLALRIRSYLAGEAFEQDDWQEILKLMPRYFEICRSQVNEAYAVARMKQWLKCLTPTWPQARLILEDIKRITCAHELGKTLYFSETSS